jgi:hypothetical protein
MRRIKLLGLSLVAVFAFGPFAASTAFAEGPEISPAGTEKAPVTFEGINNGNVILWTTADTETKCEIAKATGSFTTTSSGKVLISFEKCKSGVASCNSPGMAAGVYLTELNMQLVSVLPGGTLDLGIWLEPKEQGVAGDLTFTCGLIFKAKVLGAMIGVADNKSGALLKEKEKAKEFKLLWKQSALGEQEIKTCDTPKAFCAAGPFELKIEKSSAGHELAAKEADATLTFTKEVEFINF